MAVDVHSQIVSNTTLDTFNKFFKQDDEAQQNLEGMIFSIKAGDSIEETIYQNQNAPFHRYLKSFDKFNEERADFESVALHRPVRNKS